MISCSRHTWPPRAPPNFSSSTTWVASRSSIMNIVALLLVLACFLIPAPAAASQATAAANRWTDHNQTLGPQLVAVGAIAALEQPATGGGQQGPLEKLDYISEFMRTNRLTRFRELLQRPDPEVGQARAQLNQLDQFTLFVPTDEAMAQLQSAGPLSGLQASRFLLGHAAGRLIAQRPDVAPVPDAGEETLESLLGLPLRLTAATTNETSPERPPQLSINGASILSGHSYALQEQNNQSATYAIVHLLDKPIQPVPELNLRDLLRRWAPRMAAYFALADLEPLLTVARPPSTLLAPTDEAFRATPPKLIRQLDTNRTLLESFLRGHLLAGLHFSQQLAASAPGRTWTTEAGSEVEFEVNRLRSRSLLLANSVPVLEADLLASNGALHLLARPLFEAQILSECQCQRTQPAASSNTANELTGSGAELERDESGPQAAAARPERERWPRSGLSQLVERNNRDFYRPSTASLPAHLAQLAGAQPGAAHQAAQLQAAATSLAGSGEQRPLLFEEDRYHQVLNASVRLQRLREAGQQHHSKTPVRFTYDRLLLAAGAADQPAPTASSEVAAPAASAAANKQAAAAAKSATAEQLSAATDRQQRLLRFQAQDARPTRTSADSANLQLQQQLAGKTVAPGAGCAFYDAECKRLSGRLVRLPETRLRPTTPSPPTTPLHNHHQHHQTPVAHLDSTFGEQAGDGAPTRRPPLPPARVSLLEQPLPPWTLDEALGPLNQRGLWRGPERDISRITAPPAKSQSPANFLPGALQFAPGLSRLTANGHDWHLNATRAAPASHLKTPPQEAAIFVSPTPIASVRGQFFRPTLFAATTQPPATTFAYAVSGGLAANLSGVEPAFALAAPIAAKRAPLRLDPQFPAAPVAHRRHRLQQILMDTNGTLGANFDSSAEKQARKLVQLSQPEVQQLQLVEPIAGKGDISITSARLTNQEALLATQTSNQPSNVSQSGGVINDFFQDRTIAEIMDDSGLRIDGQQVTFSKLKDCLAEANMLSLVRQDASQLTIFMPTDAAFQRLVQQQLQLLSQQDSNRNKLSARLTDPVARQMLPLVVRRRFSGPLEPVVPADALERPDSLQDRITLDCGSHQVRQLLLDHLSAKLISPKQLQKDLSIVSLGGHQLLLSSVPSRKIVVVDGQPVVAATRAQNGMVYVLNKWLNLSQQKPNVIQLLESQPNLTTFLSYLTFSGLDERLRKETGPITVLAPTNEAFEQLTKSARQLINNPSALTDILRGHVLEGAQYGKLISMRNQLRTLNADQLIEAKVIKPNVYLLDNQMTSMRLVGTTGNGVLNSIDKLIVPAWLQANLSTSAVKPMPVVFDSSRLGANLPLISREPVQFERSSVQSQQPVPANSFLLSNGDLAAAGVLRPIQTAATFTTVPTPKPIESTARNLQLVEKLGAMMQANLFVRYMQRSRVPLKPGMNYVILVPTDQAVEKLPRQIIDMLERDLDRLDDLINYHVLDTTFEYINSIPDGTSLNTVNEKEILFNWHRNNSILTASGAVVMGGIQEDNIALLVVDRVLYPTPGNILQIISKSPILSNFTDLILTNHLEQQLTSAGPYTLFAPSDFAFNQLRARDLEILRSNKELARRFLMRHLSQPTVFTASIALSQQQLTNSSQPTMFITNALGEELQLRQKNDYFSVNDVNFSYADVAATNGVVHVIDGLL